MYKIKYNIHVEKDLSKIDQSIRKQIFNKIEKISENPNIWKHLIWNLSWLKKVYVANKKIRIIYKIIENKIEILIVAIWKRENKLVYKLASNRINNN